MKKVRNKGLTRSKASNTFDAHPLIYFNQSSSFLLPQESNYQESGDDSGTVTKKALVLIEGKQVDSNQRSHEFTPERLAQIAENTNYYLQTGNRLPLITDHKKEQGSVIGDVTGEFILKEIEGKDLYNPKLKDLVGKIGLFATEVTIKSKKAILQVREGLLNTISAGLNLTTDEIREISAVPLPAIRGCAMFKQPSAKFALTLADVDSEESDLEELKKQFVNLSEKFWKVITSIYEADVDELEDVEPADLQYQAIQDYGDRIVSLLGLDQLIGQEIMQQQMAEGQNPYGQTRGFSNPEVLAAFSLADMEKVKNAEFLFNLNLGFPGRRREPSLLERAGGVAKTAALGVGGLAALRYGGAGIRSGVSALGRGAGLGYAAKTAAAGAKVALKRDLSGKTLRTLGTKYNSKLLTGAGNRLGNTYKPIRKAYKGFANTTKTFVNDVGKGFNSKGVVPKQPVKPKPPGYKQLELF